MSYQKHKWVSNEIIRAKQLNHIEDGIYDEEQRAKNAEEDLGVSLDDEVTRATNRENEIASSVSYSEGVLDGKITANTNAINVLNAGESTVGSVDYKIAQAMSDMGGYIITLDHTQEESPSTHYIYLEPDNTATGDDKWREWIWIYDDDQGDYVWVMTGDVSLDLSNYVQKTDYATASAAGLVKPDGVSITVQNDGTIAANVASGVASFNGRTGNVTPQSGDYTKSDIGLGDVGNFKAVSTVANQGLSETEKANARTNIGAGSSTFSGDYNDLTNKPTLGTAAALDIATSGDASNSQVVKGDDTRLSDARTPTAHTHTTSQITDFPTLATVATSGSYNDLSNKPTIPGGVKIGTSRSGASDTTLYFIRS